MVLVVVGASFRLSTVVSTWPSRVGTVSGVCVVVGSQWYWWL